MTLDTFKLLAAVITIIAAYIFIGWSSGFPKSQEIEITLFSYITAVLLITLGFVLRYYFGD